MPLTSPLEFAAASAASKVRSKISRTTHDRYAWLHPPDSKEYCKDVVDIWHYDMDDLRRVPSAAMMSLANNRPHKVGPWMKSESSVFNRSHLIFVPILNELCYSSEDMKSYWHIDDALLAFSYDDFYLPHIDS